jgi:hypothetical protein
MMAVQLKHVAWFINLNTYCARLYSFVLIEIQILSTRKLWFYY